MNSYFVTWLQFINSIVMFISQGHCLHVLGLWFRAFREACVHSLTLSGGYEAVSLLARHRQLQDEASLHPHETSASRPVDLERRPSRPAETRQL
eukprot:SAG31_NODE_1763_length_7322_cov_21.697633_7_plen_94_part_00